MAYADQNSPHLIIPFASSLSEGCQAALTTVALPNLGQFLKNAECVRADHGDEFDALLPHERLLGTSNHVLITPCHWRVGVDHIRMDNPDDLQLSSEESQAFFEAVRPYFLDDGMVLRYAAPLRWYAQSLALEGLRLASLDRVIGRNVDVWQPQTEASRSIRRLQNEIQMLLYTHPLNEAREARGLPTVNSFWLSYELNALEEATPLPLMHLRQAALRSDWQSWVASWQAIDSKALQDVSSITLCGERHAHTYHAATSRSLSRKMKRLFKPAPSIQSVLQAL
ncbi:MAG: hypothetical protein QM533_01885 [Cytophagales bacterium]|nr:hypothetical protein [Cytophagales bacterium]